MLPQNGYRKPTAVLTEFSVSDCSKPAQKAATVFTCPPDTVEPSVIGRCGIRWYERASLRLRLQICERRKQISEKGRNFHIYLL